LYLMLAPHMALVNVREGLGNRVAWETLCLRINVGEILCKRCFAEIEELAEAMETAVRAISTLGKRFKQTGRMVASGDELRAIGRGLTLTDDMQDHTRKREQRDAYVFARRVMGIK
jgi:hypothetical protein